MLDVKSLNPEDGFEDPDAKGMAAAVTITAQISQNRQIVIQTYMDRDAPVAVFNRLLDKFGKSIERQEAFSSLESEKANLALEEKTLKQMLEDFAMIEERSRKAWEKANKKGPWKLNDVESNQKVTAVTNIGRYKDAIDKRKVEIAKLEAVIKAGN